MMPVLEGDNEHKNFIKEQKKIVKLKLKHEGEILAFTRKKGKLILVANALFKNDLMNLIMKARKEKKINKEDKIFYR